MASKGLKARSFLRKRFPIAEPIEIIGRRRVLIGHALLGQIGCIGHCVHQLGVVESRSRSIEGRQRMVGVVAGARALLTIDQMVRQDVRGLSLKSKTRGLASTTGVAVAEPLLTRITTEAVA
ncbi:MAG: hypothetical protein FJ167_08720 [Gammaproteobacteria bacterium]|nr:hypothetical protein [Gammaproteobacteria bacterium]